MGIRLVREQVVVLRGRVEAKRALAICTTTRRQERIVTQTGGTAAASALASEIRALEHLWEAGARQRAGRAAVGGVNALVLLEFEEEGVESAQVVRGRVGV